MRRLLLRPGGSKKILNGEYETIDGKIANAFANSYASTEYNFGVDEGLGDLKISSHDKSYLLKLMQDDEFMCTLPDLTDEQKIYLFLMHRFVHGF